MIELMPPSNYRPPDRVKLNTGATVFPNRTTGLVKVRDEEDAEALEAMGWRRDKISAHFKSVGDDLLRKGLAAQDRHIGIAKHSLMGHVPADQFSSHTQAHSRIEIGEVETREHGRLRVAHDRADGTLIVHDVAVRMEEIDHDLRDSVIATSAAFSLAATAENQ